MSRERCLWTEGCVNAQRRARRTSASRARLAEPYLAAFRRRRLWCSPRAWQVCHFRSGVASQARQVEHPDPPEFDLKQSGRLKLVQRLVGSLARHGGKQSDLVLRELD